MQINQQSVLRKQLSFVLRQKADGDYLGVYIVLYCLLCVLFRAIKITIN